MNRRTFMRGASLLAVGLSAAGLAGCEVAVVRPAYGRFDYYYYPDVNVYFHVWTGYYYYYVDGVWVRATVLPGYILLDPVYRQVLVIEDPLPYRHNAQHRQRYARPAQVRPAPAQAPSRQQRQADAEERLRLEEALRRMRRRPN